MSDHDFCKVSVRAAREIAREAGVKLPKGLHAVNLGDNDYEVWSKTTNGPLWYGEACCSYEARGKAITQYMRDVTEPQFPKTQGRPYVRPRTAEEREINCERQGGSLLWVQG